MSHDFKRAITNRQRDIRKNNIIMSAKQLLEEKDYDEISIGQIADKADVAKGTIYIYFDSKQEIFLELMMEELKKWKEDFRFSVEQYGIQGLYESCKKMLYIFRRATQILTAEKEKLPKNIAQEKYVKFRQTLQSIFWELDKIAEERIDFFEKGDFLQLLIRISVWNIGLYHTAKINLVIVEILTSGKMENKDAIIERSYNEFVLDLIEKIKLKNKNIQEGGVYS